MDEATLLAAIGEIQKSATSQNSKNKQAYIQHGMKDYNQII